MNPDLPLEQPGLNMTPMLDVVFNLLIFFLLSSTYLAEESQLELRVPQVASAAPISDRPTPLTVNILADGRLRIGDRSYDVQGLRRRLEEVLGQYPERAVALRGDREVPYGRVAEVVSACRQAGVKRINPLVIQE